MEIKRETKVVEYIEYDGIRFYRDGRGYWLSKHMLYNGRTRPVRLHVYVWEKHNGAIPKGYHVHHKDKNPDNNELENLELIEKHEHLSMHMDERAAASRERMRNIVIPAAAEWHHSEAGHEWHKAQYENVSSKVWLEPVTKTCIVCGAEYQTVKSKAKQSKFCSEKCKAQYRRNSGIDDISRKCEVCGAVFSTNKYSPARFCSKECRLTGSGLAKNARDFIPDR